MQNLKIDTERRTTTDIVFDSLHEEIVSLKLLPGTKMSEAEIAQRFGVSRQPVRDAFNRLFNLDLVLIRPQKSTVVRGFSEEAISQARFIRLAVELEVVNRACVIWDVSCTKKSTAILEQQVAAVGAEQWDRFHALDLEFHSLICELSNTRFAIDCIRSCRQKTDRMCVLSLDHDTEVDQLLDDHRTLIQALENRDVNRATAVTRLHLSRLDSIIEEVRVTHADYFE